MSLRLIEIVLPSDQTTALRELLDANQIVDRWDETLADGRILARIVLDAGHTGSLVDDVDERFGRGPGFQLLVLPVEAALPRREEPPAGAGAEPGAKKPAFGGLSREELYHDVADMTGLSRVFLTTVVLSTVVAAVGILRDNVAVIIGAMVIAPLLGPNIALAFGTAVGDLRLIRRSLVTNVVGVVIALGLTIAIGLIVTVDSASAQIASRAEVRFADMVLALASGAAGALALTAGVPSALVGVMVAVALLPPTAVVGLSLGAGHWSDAGAATLMLATNVICINLTGVVTLLLQGIRPRSWWEKDRARRSARVALLIWVALLAVLAGLIVVGRQA